MSLRVPVRITAFRGHKQTVAPTVEPVTAAELRTHLRETATGLPDSEANAFIAEARTWIEQQTNIAMTTQTWLVAMDRWPSAREEWWDGVRQGSRSELYGPQSYSDITLPRYPLQNVSGVNVYDEDGNATAVSVATVFDVDTYSTPGRMNLKRGQTWPIALRANNAIEVTYVSGYGDTAADVPAPLAGAVKRLAAHLYAHRGDGCEMDDAWNKSGAKSMIDSYKLVQI